MSKTLELDHIYQMDVIDFLNKLDNESLDLAIVDPPYNMSKDKWDTFNSEKDYFDFTYKWLNLMIRKMKKSGSFYLFNTPYNSAIILYYLKQYEDIYFKNWITWYKKDGFSSTRKKYVNNQETILFYSLNENKYTFNSDDVRQPYLSTSRIEAAKTKGILKNGKRWFPNEQGRLCTDVWEITSQRHLQKQNGKILKQEHPTPKPIEMIERMILASSNDNDIVLDLFSGTGTTSYVAKKLKRRYIGCELQSEYIEIINKRLLEV